MFIVFRSLKHTKWKNNWKTLHSQNDCSLYHNYWLDNKYKQYAFFLNKLIITLRFTEEGTSLRTETKAISINPKEISVGYRAPDLTESIYFVVVIISQSLWVQSLPFHLTTDHLFSTPVILTSSNYHTKHNSCFLLLLTVDRGFVTPNRATCITGSGSKFSPKAFAKYIYFTARPKGMGEVSNHRFAMVTKRRYIRKNVVWLFPMKESLWRTLSV